MKIIMLRDYNGKLTGNNFLASGEQDVSPDLAERLIEHGLAEAAAEDSPEPEAVETPKRKRGKHGG